MRQLICSCQVLQVHARLFAIHFGVIRYFALWRPLLRGSSPVLFKVAMVFLNFGIIRKISLISHRLALWKNKRGILYLWNFVPIAVHALNPKKQAIGNAFVLCCAKCNFTKQPADRKAEARTGVVIQPKAKPFMTVIREEDQKSRPCRQSK